MVKCSMLATALVAALLGVAEARAAGLPVRAGARPLTLPGGWLRVDADVMVWRTYDVLDPLPGVAGGFLGGPEIAEGGATATLGLGVGITDGLELGGTLLSGALVPDARWGGLTFYARYGWDTDALDVAVELGLTAPASFDLPVISLSVPLRGAVGMLDVELTPWLGVAYGNLSRIDEGDAELGVRIPLRARFAVTDQLAVSLETGVHVGVQDFGPAPSPRGGVGALDTFVWTRRFIRPADAVVVPLGLAVGYTFTSADAPLFDLALRWSAPVFLVTDDADHGDFAVDGDDFTVGIGGKLYWDI